MKYRQQDEGESEKETTSPKVVEVPPLAEDSTEDLPSPEDGEGGEMKRNTDSSPEDILRKRVTLVKSYAWIKEEMLESVARSVADYMYQHERYILSDAEHENICNSKTRRGTADQLLKRVLMGPDEILDIFIKILKDQGGENIVKKLSSTAPTDEEVEVFTTLEESSLQRCPRPCFEEPRFNITTNDHQTLIYYLNIETTIDTINDNLLSRFYFSIREHNNIVLCSLDHERRVTLLLDTMKLCSDKIFRTFCEVLKSVKMRHVLEKLERKCPSLGKRKSAPDVNDTENPSTSRPKAKIRRQCVNSSIEYQLVASIQKSSSKLKHEVAEDLDFDLDTVNKGSIIIQLRPRSAESWKKLENNCLTGKIKDFIPKVYRNEAIHELLKDGEYKLKFTIYTLPGTDEEESEKKAMFHLETEHGAAAEAKQPVADDNPIEDQMDLLCEEFEITKDLLDDLKKSKLVEDNIKEQIDKQGSRAKKIKFLLKKVAFHGITGYEVLKSHIKDSNEDLYSELVSREGVKVIDKRLDHLAKVGQSRRTSQHRSIYSKQVFFTGVAVLKVKKNGNKKGFYEALLQNSPDYMSMISGHYRTALVRMLSGYASRSDLRRRLANTDVDCDNNFSIDPKKRKETVDPGFSETDWEVTCLEILEPVCHFKMEGDGEEEDRGGVTMVLEEDWDSVGETKPESEILVGKRKHTTKGDPASQKSVKKQASEESHETASETDEESDLKASNSDTEVMKNTKETGRASEKSDENEKTHSKEDNP